LKIACLLFIWTHNSQPIWRQCHRDARTNYRAPKLGQLPISDSGSHIGGVSMLHRNCSLVLPSPDWCHGRPQLHLSACTHLKIWPESVNVKGCQKETCRVGGGSGVLFLGRPGGCSACRVTLLPFLIATLRQGLRSAALNCLIVDKDPTWILLSFHSLFRPYSTGHFTIQASLPHNRSSCGRNVAH
jgi:hypothetical protein